MLSKKFTAVAGASEPTDDYFENVTLLLHGDGTNGAQNNGTANPFLDSSSNGFTITRNGNTTQGSYSPYGSLWSNYTSSITNSRLSGNAAIIGSSTSTFTVEAFIYMTSAPTTADADVPTLIGLDAEAYAGGYYFTFGVTTGQNVRLYWYDGVKKTCTGSTTIPLNTWVHIAVVVNSNAITLYVNGVSETLSGTTTLTNRAGTTGTSVIGANNYTTFYGYWSNIRVSNIARTITVPTVPYTADANTLVLQGGSNNFTSTGTLSVTWTAGSSGPSVQRFSPFNPTAAYSTATIGGSGYFDGSGDYLSLPSDAAFNNLSGTTFTLEFWMYPTAYANGGAGVESTTIFSTSDTYPNGFRVDLGTSSIVWYDYVGSTRMSYAVPLNAWTHVAFTYTGNVLTMYVNGVSRATASSVTWNNSSTTAFIGALKSGSYNYYYQGYLSNLRLTSSTVYTGTFTPPTLAPLATSGASSAAAYPSTTNVNTSFASSACSLLTGYTNAGIYDNAMMNDLETVGGAQISTSVKKYGTGSIAFDGTGDYLAAPSMSSNTMGTGDFTIEMWVYPTTVTGTFYLCSIGSEAAGRYVVMLVNGVVVTNLYGSGNATLGGSVSATTWTHIAISRSGSTIRGFVNGTVLGTTETNSSSIGNGPLKIASDSSGGNTFNGYIDDFRLTKGLARYTSSFTAPTSALPNK